MMALFGADGGNAEREPTRRVREPNCKFVIEMPEPGRIETCDGKRLVPVSDGCGDDSSQKPEWINRNACASEKGKSKKEKDKLKTQLLDRCFGFVVACFLGFTKARPLLDVFLSQALPVGFECGRRDGFM
jgi:hypothetical protein